MTPELQDRVIHRLIETGVADKPWALTIVAALEGVLELDAFLDGEKKREVPKPSAAPGPQAAADPPGVYVASLTVQGFRGVSKAVALNFKPGPGLTLVVGRNGSGKSSLAEGLELLLTNSNYRWADRPKVWQQGWQNLHKDGHTCIKADLLVEGEGAVNVEREWKSGDLGKSETAARKGGRTVSSILDQWRESLVTFRPFLSYNELGSLLDEGPSKLYDALSRVLGLEDLVEVQKTLASARKSRQDKVESAKTVAKELIVLIEAARSKVTDDRFEKALTALQWPRVDLRLLEQLVVGAHDDSADLELLRQLKALQRPEVTAILEAAGALRAAQADCDTFSNTDIARSLELAELLQDAVHYHERHKDSTCPVCATASGPSSSWHTRTIKEIERLRKKAQAYEAAIANRAARIKEAQRFLGSPPPTLARAAHLGLATLPEARRLWIAWSEGRDIKHATALAAHLEDKVGALDDAVVALIDEADDELRKRTDIWQPIAMKIAAFLPEARVAMRAIPRIAELKAAEDWWKNTAAEIRDERFEPVAERAIAIWKELRLKSSVDLGGISLEGSAQRRKVSLEVTVDGKPGEALGVMSQGELHALSLSLFLPRATLPESPFRFVWIDDPVQSMDPARVEGLAKILADTARSRQVVVFTHDDRLPEAIRRLNIPATVLSVTRRVNSAVEVRQSLDPVTSSLDDAIALTLTKELPSDVVSRVVPGFCRAAIEAACMEVVRRRRLGRGELHDVVEQLLIDNAKPHPLMALALFDDPHRTNDVLSKLNKIAKEHADAFQACKAGSHVSHDGDLDDLIAKSDRLARYVLKECR